MTVHKEGIHRRMMDFDLLDDSITTGKESDATEVAMLPFGTAKTASDHSHPPAGLHCQPAEWFVVRVRRELGVQDVVALVRYLTDFGSGDARGVAVEGGWSIHLTKLADLQLVTAQYPDLIERHSVSCKSSVENGQPLAF